MPEMLAYVIKRLLLLLPVILVAVTLVFVLFELIPGDIASILVGLKQSTRAGAEAMRQYELHLYGLDKPVWERYLSYLWRLAHLDLGFSFTTPTVTVVDRIAAALPVTMVLSVLSLLLSLVIGVPLGIVAAVYRGTKKDLAASTVALAGVSVPSFWLGLMLLILLTVDFRLLPSMGYVNPLTDPIGGLSHMVLPAFTLAVALAGNVARITRSSLLEVLLQDYVLTARAKGLSARTVIYKHALKNAMIPVATVTGLNFAGVLGGVVVIETIFVLPGMGRLLFMAVTARDYPLIEGVVLVIILMVALVNLGTDILYKYLDPRVKL